MTVGSDVLRVRDDVTGAQVTRDALPEPTSGTVVLTGAAGAVGSALRPLLSRGFREVVLLDLVAVPGPLVPNERVVCADVTDLAAVRAAVAGAAVVVHLAGYHSERPWAQIEAVNVGGSHTVLEACRLEGVVRVLLASSIHAVGTRTVAEVLNEPEPSPAPDTYYGWSKVAVEALGRLFASRFQMAVVSARIGTAEPRPSSVRALSTWLSPGDLYRLVDVVAHLETPGGHVVWAVSANTRRWVHAGAGEAIGYFPLDDAEAWAGQLGDPDPFPTDTVIGGAFVDDAHPVGGTW